MRDETISWIYFADKDMAEAQYSLGSYRSRGGVAVNCQQAIEKYFKAYWIEHGKKVLKTHNLVTLYEEVEKIQDWKLDKDLLKDLSEIYIDHRYPGNFGITPEGIMPTVKETQRYFEFAQEVETIFKKLCITKIDDIKDIIEQNHALKLTSQNMTLIDEMVRDGKIEFHQAYNNIIEEIHDVREKLYGNKTDEKIQLTENDAVNTAIAKRFAELKQ